MLGWLLSMVEIRLKCGYFRLKPDYFCLQFDKLKKKYIFSTPRRLDQILQRFDKVIFDKFRVENSLRSARLKICSNILSVRSINPEGNDFQFGSWKLMSFNNCQKNHEKALLPTVLGTLGMKAS